VWSAFDQEGRSCALPSISFRFSQEGSAMIRRGMSLLVVLAVVLPASAQDFTGPGTWAFTHTKDPFDSKALLDLRFLNEKEAGESGFLKVAPDGRGFVLGDGKPARLWAIGSDVYRKASREEMARHARFLAKLGVNMVRIHTQLNTGAKGSKLTDVDQKEIDHIWQFVAALKKEGIYVTISPYWATSRDVSNWGINGVTGQADLWGLLFFDAKVQEGYKAWARALYEPKNPYTDMPLAKDPAVGIIQVQNEDSLLFWTTMGMKPAIADRFGKKLGDWLVKKYGSLDKALAAWENVKHDQDKLGDGKVGLFKVWHMTQDLKGGLARRINDEHQFYAEIQRQFYADIGDFYRKELGCKQLLNASNWTTADNVRLNDTERWTYSALDVQAVNRYTGGTHVGDNNGWRIDPGHKFTASSCLTDPRSLPINLKQVVGQPIVITESTWVHPESYQTEGPFLIAAYESLTGVAGYYWFSATAVEFDLDPSLKFLNLGGQHPLFKWSCSTPAFAAQFPAAALLYRKGYLKRGEPVVHEERPMADVFERRVPLIAEDKSFDPNRYQGATGGEKSKVKGGADPLAFLVGPVEVKYGGDASKTTVADLARYIDKDKKTVASVTGELKLDYGNGLCTMNAPKAQGVSGFLKKAGEIKLADVRIQSQNEYATVYVVPLDDQQIKDSKKLLVQVGTSVRLTGWQTKPVAFKADGKNEVQGFEIVQTGKAPWRVIDTDVTLTINNAGIKTATLLDTAGYAAKKFDVEQAGGKLTVKLPANALYVVLE
jgi:hypothetical protein